MHTETYIAIIVVLFLVIALRPEPKVIIREDRSSHGSPIWVIILLIIGAALWLLLGERPEQNGDAGTTVTHKMKATPDTLINKSPQRHRIQTAGSTKVNKPGPAWVVLLKKCYSENEVTRLQRVFPTRAITSVEMTNGQFWAVIYARSNLKSEADAEVKDWMRHQDDCQTYGITPATVNLYHD